MPFSERVTLRQRFEVKPLHLFEQSTMVSLVALAEERSAGAPFCA
jgi:hypothetical protein